MLSAIGYLLRGLATILSHPSAVLRALLASVTSSAKLTAERVSFETRVASSVAPSARLVIDRDHVVQLIANEDHGASGLARARGKLDSRRTSLACS